MKLESSNVSPAHRALLRRYTHSPITINISVGIYVFLGHIKRVDRRGLAPNFECHIDLSIAINDPDITTKEREILQVCALSARVDCIRDIPVARAKLGVREYKKR